MLCCLYYQRLAEPEAEAMVSVCRYSHKAWDENTYLYIKFAAGLTKPTKCMGEVSSHRHLLMWLLRHALNSVNPSKPNVATQKDNL